MSNFCLRRKNTDSYDGESEKKRHAAVVEGLKGAAGGGGITNGNSAADGAALGASKGEKEKEVGRNKRKIFWYFGDGGSIVILV